MEFTQAQFSALTAPAKDYIMKARDIIKKLRLEIRDNTLLLECIDSIEDTIGTLLGDHGMYSIGTWLDARTVEAHISQRKFALKGLQDSISLYLADSRRTHDAMKTLIAPCASVMNNVSRIERNMLK
jgi:hypothetical protein